MKVMASILVLDDDLALLEQMERLLNTLGHTAKLSLEHEHLFKRLEKEPFDLILMDIHMPGSNGIAILQQLQSHPVYQRIPVIMLTIDPDDNLLKQCFDAGAADFINKPLSEVILQARIEMVLKIKTYQDQLLEKNNELADSLEIQQNISDELLQTSDELRNAQRHLAKILDIAEDAIITVDEAKQINFLNQQAEQMLGYTAEEVLGQSLDLLIPPEINPAKSQTVNITGSEQLTNPIKETRQMMICPKNQPQRLIETSFFNLKLEDETLVALVLHEFSSPPPANAPAFQISSRSQWTDELQRERHRIQALGEAFDGAIKFLFEGGQALIQELRSVDQVLDGMSDYLSEESETEELRELLVHVLSLSLEYWEKSMDKTKIELAEESGIWKVHLDNSTFRTKTLDRYLSLETLPQKPRWKEVLATARYVLTHCPPSQPLQSDLESAVFKLKHLLNAKPA